MCVLCAGGGWLTVCVLCVVSEVADGVCVVCRRWLAVCVLCAGGG